MYSSHGLAAPYIIIAALAWLNITHSYSQNKQSISQLETHFNWEAHSVDRLLRGVWISAQVVLLVCWIVCSREIVKIKGDPAQQQWSWVEMSPAQWSIDPAVLLPARYLDIYTATQEQYQLSSYTITMMII